MIELEKELSEKLSYLLKKTNLNVNKEQQIQLVKFVLLLNKWNKAYNLTSVRNPIDMLVKHILDSLVVSPYLKGNRFIDVGTGPGLPGIPLAIINPDKEFVLLDSLGKRIQFIRNALRELGIKNVTPVLSRVEEYKPDHLFDGVLSRAFASLQDMTNWCHHLPKKENGYFYALKGQCNDNEINELGDNFKIKDQVKLDIPNLIGDRHLILIKNC